MSRGLSVVPTAEAHRVTTLELFFDLVFVFALTQVTALMAGDPSGRGVLRGVVLLALLWWAWCSFAWLGNQARADEGAVRAAVVSAMAALFVVALAIPESFDDLGGGVIAPAVVGLCYAVVRFVHLAVYWIAAGDDVGLRRQLARTFLTVALATGLLVTGGFVGPPWQTLLWALALLVDYTGIWLSGVEGWRLNAPVHFAERHGLIVIVALGESIVAVGVGVAGAPLTWAVVVAGLLALTVTVSLWWLYFDVVALVAERVLSGLTGVERARMGRDSYTYLHFPLIVGIVLLALGLKKVLEYVSDTEHHELSDPLTGVPLVALFGGVTLYLAAHVAFRRRNVGTVNVPRLVVAALLVLAVPVAARLPALASLAVLAGLLVGLVAYEAMRYAEARHRVRHEVEQRAR